MSFAGMTDHWSYADTNIVLISSGDTPNRSEAQCQDSYGDVSASTMYDSFTEHSCVYAIKAGASIKSYDTTTAVDFRMGKVISSKVIGNIEVSTEDVNNPQITISGRSTSMADSDVRKYDWSDLVTGITGIQKAQAVGGSVDTNSKLRSWSGTGSVELSPLLDSNGQACHLDAHTGRLEATLDFVGCAGAPGASADTGWTENPPSSDDESNTEYGTGSLTVFKNVAGS